jgi:hypothetical protein
VQRDTPSDSNLALELHLHTLMDEYLLQEESLWRTKSRELWLTSVDLNTKFFHTSTLIRCRRNSIDILQSPNFGWLTESRDIGACFINNFKNLFTTSNHALPTEFMDLFDCSVSENDNTLLCAQLTDFEIYKTTFVPGRLIQDNSILAHEMLHTLKHKRGRGGLMTINIDMEKAFDKME